MGGGIPCRPNMAATLLVMVVTVWINVLSLTDWASRKCQTRHFLFCWKTKNLYFSTVNFMQTVSYVINVMAC